MGLPIWSPAGDQIAFYTTRGWGVGYYSVVSPDGSNLRRLIPEGGTGAWSHDGRWFYYAAQVREGVGEDLRLKKIDVRDGTVVHLRDENATSPAPARDGTLYFTTQLPTIAGNFDVEVRAANPENAAARVLTRIPSDRLAPWQRLNVVVSPDGKSLAVPLTDGATTNIWAISTTDGAFRQLTDFGSRPTFIVRRVSWSADGRWVFAAVGEGDADIVLLAGLHP
jgi:Tol biopolymer transport system component